MAGKVGSHPFFTVYEQYEGRHPLYDADVSAARQIEPIVQNLQILVCQHASSSAFCSELIANIKQCTSQIIGIYPFRFKGTLKD